MSCVNCNLDGICIMFDKESFIKRDEDSELDSEYGYDKDGNCLVEEDEEPLESCPWYDCVESEEDEDEAFEE